MSRLRAMTALALLAGLAGCGAGHEFQDLQGYMDEVRARPQGRIEPMPTFQPYEAFTYGAAGLRSPFQPPVPAELAGQQRGSRDIKPDESRARQFLEGFNIELFEMVGSLSNAEGMYALVRGAGGVHRIRIGDYLGRNHGKVVAIDANKVEVLEIVPDGDGGWLERPRSMSLTERS